MRFKYLYLASTKEKISKNKAQQIVQDYIKTIKTLPSFKVDLAGNAKGEYAMYTRNKRGGRR